MTTPYEDALKDMLKQAEADLEAARAEIERLTVDNEAILAARKAMNEQAEDLSSRLYRAEAERDEARAQVAMAYEVAARRTESRDVEYPSGTIDMEGEELREILRALTPADAKNALEAYGREKVREGMKMASDLIDQNFDRNGWRAHKAILAAMEKEGGE